MELQATELMSPKYSVAIPAYNRREYIEQTIEWTLQQTVSDWELLVCDDCSTQDLGTTVEAIGDPRVKYYRNPTRLGATRNHQRAVQLSQGQYVITLNSDDLLLPECLATAGACLDRNPSAAGVYFSLTYLRDGKVDGCQHMPKIRYANAEVFAAEPWLERYVGTTPSCCLFRRKSFEQIAGYRTSLRFAYDWDFYMRLMKLGGGVMFLPEVLAVYRRHQEQMVQQNTLDGLRDMLDLWRLPEYQHWPADLLATIAFNEVRSFQARGQPVRSVLRELTRRHLFWKVASGLPKDILARLVRRLKRPRLLTDENYVVPPNLAKAIATAQRLLSGARSNNGHMS
jgi:glycosyltransferase involved in cell wall biosynthesis